MRVVFIGQSDPPLESKIENVIRSFPTVAEAVEWFISELPEFEQVLLVQNGLSKESSNTDQISDLQNALNVISNGCQLSVILNDRSLEHFIKNNGLLTYSPSFLDYRDRITVKDIIEVLEDDQSDVPENEIQLTDDKKSVSNKNKYVPPVELLGSVDAKTIVICNLYPDCGSTFIATNVASMLDELGITVAVAEYPENKPVLYDYLFGDEKAPENWHSLIERISNDEPISAKDYWKSGNITWFPIGKTKESIQIDKDSIYYLLTATRVSQIVLIDISNNWNTNAIKTTLDACNEIWVVMKPNPAKFEAYLDEFKGSMSRWENKIKFIGNCWNKYSSNRSVMKEIREAIRHTEKEDDTAWKETELITTIEQFEPDMVSKAEWEGILLADLKETKQSVKQAFRELLETISTNIQVNKTPDSSPKGLLNKLMKR